MKKSAIQDKLIIYLISNILHQRRIGKSYVKRWKIEYCFKHLKTNGSNLEDMSLTDLKKIRLMIALGVVAYIMAVIEGIIQQKLQPLRVIKYQNGDKLPAVFLFRNGLQVMSNQIINWVDFEKYLAVIKPKKYSIVPLLI